MRSEPISDRDAPLFTEVVVAMAESLPVKPVPVPFLHPGVEERWLNWHSAALGRSGVSLVEAEMEDWCGFIPPSRDLVMHVLLPGTDPTSATRDLGDGRRDTLRRAGQICITPAGQPGHWAWSGRFRDLNLVIPAKFLDELAHDAGLAGIPDLMSLARAPQEDPFIESVILRLRHTEGEQAPILTAEYDHAVALVLYWLLRKSEPALPRPRGGLPAPAIRRVRAYIEENLGRDLSVAELAELVGLSTPYFSHAFRTAFGEAPYQHILRRRCARACSLLKRQDPLSEVALAVGFASQSHFTTVFRRVMGTTPAAWRRAHSG